MARTRSSSIAVQLAGTSVQLLQLELRGDAGKVTASAQVAPPPAEGAGRQEPLSSEFAGLVASAIKDRGFRGSKAIACVPSDQLLIRHVKVAAMDGPALQDALLFELEDAFPGDTPMVQSIHVGEVMERGERLHEHILLASGHQRMRRLVDFLTAAGLHPGAIDVEAGALMRCFLRRRRRQGDEKDNAIVHIGENTTLAVITGADAPLFMKQLPVGAVTLRGELQSRLDLSEEDLVQAIRDPDSEEELRGPILHALRLPIDSLVQELAACLRYHAASRRSPSGVGLILCGPGAAIPGFADAVAEGLGQGCSRPDPFTPSFSGVESPGAMRNGSSSWCVPLGLALRGAVA